MLHKTATHINDFANDIISYPKASAALLFMAQLPLHTLVNAAPESITNKNRTIDGSFGLNNRQSSFEPVNLPKGADTLVVNYPFGPDNCLSAAPGKSATHTETQTACSKGTPVGTAVLSYTINGNGVTTTDPGFPGFNTASNPTLIKTSNVNPTACSTITNSAGSTIWGGFNASQTTYKITCPTVNAGGKEKNNAGVAQNIAIEAAILDGVLGANI